MLYSFSRLQVHEKPLQPRKSPRKSPRKTPRKRMQEPPPPVPSVAEKETGVTILQQDWEETTDCMDMTNNIQSILDGLSNEEPMEEASSEPTTEKIEEKENVAEASSVKKLFPLFYKGETKPQPAT